MTPGQPLTDLKDPTFGSQPTLWTGWGWEGSLEDAVFKRDRKDEEELTKRVCRVL